MYEVPTLDYVNRCKAVAPSPLPLDWFPFPSCNPDDYEYVSLDVALEREYR
jgi:hypothetical protein